MRIRVDKKGSLDFMFPDFGHKDFERKYGHRSDVNLYVPTPVRHTCVTICENCGAEIFGVWGYYRIRLNRNPAEKRILDEFERIKQLYDNYANECEEEFKSIKTLNTCPICNGQIKMTGQTRPAKYEPYWNDRAADGEFEIIKERLSKFTWTVAASYELQAYTKQLDQSADTVLECMSPDVINSCDTLKQYLLKLVRLETDIMSLRRRLLALYQKRIENNLKVKTIDYLPVFEMKKRIEDSQIKYNEAESEYQKCVRCLEQCTAKTPKPVTVPELPKPTPPTHETPGLFNKKKIIAQNAAKDARYELELQEYERKCKERLDYIELQTKKANEEYNLQVQQAQEAVDIAKFKLQSLQVNEEAYSVGESLELCPEKAFQIFLNDEIKAAEDLLSKLYHARNKLYAADVIYEKYRNVVALSTFYEYLMSGRCDSLVGADGAYNLYESETRANLIISNLTEINKSLDKIQQTQYLICSQLKAMNRALDTVNETLTAAYNTIIDIKADTTGIRENTNDMNSYLEQISKNSSIVAHNTAATAYYAKINSELTDALGFMVALK